jgi:hypothetical protein
MNAPLAWDELLREARNLEIKVDARDGHVIFCQCGSGQHGKFEQNLAGCQKAAVWLAALRQAIDVRDQLRSRELPRRRCMSMRYLWRR